ncbi:iron-containing alcohol dehydrogenase [Thalassotalea psychrophila]|uniref:Iron-containing alcohol dehydrogenase n=1 Tax=Thalassotalea psychrophila TaxID=3065647 RepID=A0ABY9TZB4_9GAMM|nr:iron-containing alcohol dehydrogenase [Colwelliaceae bacterium SQ149]
MRIFTYAHLKKVKLPLTLKGITMLHTTIIKIRKQANKVLNIPMPTLIEGEGKVTTTTTVLKQLGGSKPLIVTDGMLVKLGIAKHLTDALDAEGMPYVLFDRVTPDPTIPLINEGILVYKNSGCDSIIALGGGSPMDCAKTIGASVVKNKAPQKLAGTMRVRKELPPLIAIPTTAGTGSEATVVAVVTDPVARKKLTIVDPKLVPNVAIIDPALMLGLPAKITAETGIDALTHAVESYIGKHATELTREYGLEAVKRIFKYLPKAYADGSDIEARREMSVASYKAGVAFTRASIGYVHAIAHQLGGFYHIPHGLANAVILPHVLEFSFDEVFEQYAELAIAAGLATESDTKRDAATKFVNGVKALNKLLNIQTNFPELKEDDVVVLADRAVKEAFGAYPVPKQMNQKQCEEIMRSIMG